MAVFCGKEHKFFTSVIPVPLRPASYLGERPNQHRRGSFLTQGQDIRVKLANHKTRRERSMGTTLPEVGIEIETRSWKRKLE